MADKRGKNPNSRANLKKGNPETQFSGRKAVEMGQRSQEVQREYKTFREGAREALTPEVMAAITAAIVEKAMAGDVRAYEVIRDTMGEKPKENLELTGNGAVRFMFGTDTEGDELSG